MLRGLSRRLSPAHPTIFTAFVAWVVLGERLKTPAIVALVTAICGLAFMFKDGIAGGTLWGNFFALGAMLTYSIYVIMLRYTRNIDTFVASGFGGMVATGFAGTYLGRNVLGRLPEKTFAWLFRAVMTLLALRLLVISFT